MKVARPVRALALAVTLGLAGCPGGRPAPPTLEQRGGGSCHEGLPLVVPDAGATAPGYTAAVECVDGACVLAIAHGDVRQRHELVDFASRSEVATALADVDGDGQPELVVDAELIQDYGPDGQMAIIAHTLFVLDGATLAYRWSAPGWANEPPEPQSTACASEAVLRDEDCDGRRETLEQIRRCDAPMCADLRAGKPEDNEFIRDECGAITPGEERAIFRAAQPGVIFAAT